MRGSVLVIFDKCLKLISGLIIGTYIARILGPENYGLMGYAQSIVALIVVISGFGLESLFIKRLNSAFNEARIVILVSKIRLTLSVLSCVLFVLISYVAVSDEKLMSLFIIFSILIISNNMLFIEHVYYSKGKSKQIGKISIFITTISIGLKLFLISVGGGVYSFSLVIVIESIMLVALYWIFIYRNLDVGISIKLQGEEIKATLRNGLPLMISGASVIIYMKVDQIMIERLISIESVGIYNSATRLIESSYFFPVVIANIFLPSILRKLKDNYKESLDEYRFILNKILMFSIISSVVVSCNSEGIIKLLYGDEYLGASVVLMIYSFAFPFVVLGVFSSKLIVQTNLEKFLLYRSIVGCLINIILNIILIPMLGLKGAAIATLIAQAFVSHFSLSLTKKTLQFYVENNKSIVNFKRV